MSDVLIFQSTEDGEITVEDGIVQMSGGLASAAYLALFGGNSEDGQRDADPNQWWGNQIEIDPDFTYRSATQHILRSMPLTSPNLRKLEIAAENDLAFFISKGIATDVSVSTTIQSANKVKITCEILAEGEEQGFEYITNWGDTP